MLNYVGNSWGNKITGTVSPENAKHLENNLLQLNIFKNRSYGYL